MKNQPPVLRVILSIVTTLVLLFSATSALDAGATSIRNGPGGDGDVRTAVHPQTGMLTFLGTSPSAPLSVPGLEASSLSPRARGESILDVYAPRFGVSNPRTDLSLKSERLAGNDRQVLRYQQIYQGVPVIAGELILNFNAGGLVSISGELSPALNVVTTPNLGPRRASEAALQLVAKYYDVDASSLSASEPALWIYDARLLESSAKERPHLVWLVEVRAQGQPVRELVLINALRGNVSLHFNQVDTAWTGRTSLRSGRNEVVSAPPAANASSASGVLGTPSLATYDSLGTSGQQVSLVCANNSRNCGSGDADANSAHAFAYDTYMAYASAPYNRDSIDGAGMTLISNVHWDEVDYCPNAFWDGYQMTYCDGLAADDVVAHELTHGVTQYESNLFYYWEAGAINESLSDVWGEYVDQTNTAFGGSTDGATYDWKIGEDATGIGVIRDMKNPPAYRQPDSMTSTYYCKSGSCYTYDNGGVHTNSGVNNKATYLMVNGGTFNSKTVTALGWDKTIAIFYEVQTNLLTSGSGYYDLYHDLYQACVSIVGTNGITFADCQEVRDATDAVKMNLEPTKGFNPNTPICPANTSFDSNLFTDDFETGTDGWTMSTSSDWMLWSDTVYYSNFGPLAYDGTDSLYGDDIFPLNEAIATSPNIVLPPGSKPYLYFSHIIWLEPGYDGGVLEYSLNGGAFTDAAALYAGGQNYNKTISKYYGSIIGGQKAFSGDSHGYVTSLFNLTNLAGNTVRFRWRMVTDNGTAVGGWWLDSVEVNTCAGLPSAPVLASPANNALIHQNPSSPLITLEWSDSTPVENLDHYELEVSTDAAFTPGPSTNTYNTGTVSSYTFGALLPQATTYYWHVRALNSIGGASAWSASRSFRIAYTAPTLLTPANLSTGVILKPTFDWDDAAGAVSYTIQVSRYSTFRFPTVNKTVTLSTYTMTTNLPRNKVMYWRVRVNGPYGPSAWTVFQFTTMP